MRRGIPTHVIIAVVLFGVVALAAACSELLSSLYSGSSSSSDSEHPPPPPACRSWQEVGHWMRVIADDPQAEAAAGVPERFRDYVPDWYQLKGGPQLWLVWLEVQIGERPELAVSTGFAPDDEAFEAARRSAGWRALVARLRAGRPAADDRFAMRRIPHALLFDAAVQGLANGNDLTGTRLLIDGLVLLDDPRVVPALVATTEDGPDHRRRHVRHAVARLHDPRTVLYCIHMLGAETRAETFTAHTALVRITGEGFSRKDPAAWALHWKQNRDRYPAQLLPPGRDEASILSAAQTP